ncbi:MAG: alginate export family protein [Bacteroidota bacterium]
MRHLLLFVCFVFSFPFGMMAQADSTKIPVDIQFLRAQEHYQYLAEANKKNTWESLKYIRLNRKGKLYPYVSFGADFRSEFQVRHNENWNPKEDDVGVLFQRIMVHSDWQLSKQFRLFVQLKSGHTVGRNGPKFFLDNDDLDVHQAFLQLRMDNWRLEFGRRELWYGSRRLISIREGTNIRQSFDGGRIIYEQNRHRLDALFFAYNPQRTGIFDNPVNFDQLLWGAYYTGKQLFDEFSNFDLYYLGSYQAAPSFERGDSEDQRHSIGIRHFGNWGKLSFNSEAIVQFGQFGEQNIQAWTISTDLGFTWIEQDQFRSDIGLKLDLISGDQDPMDNTLQTFNPLYPRGGYFGLLAIIGPANLIDFHPSIDFGFGEKWSLTIDWDFFWRQSLNDGIYFPSGRLQVASDGSRSRYIGSQGGLEVVYEVNPFLELETSWFYFFSGDFIQEVTPGSNVSQFGLSLKFRI